MHILARLETKLLERLNDEEKELLGKFINAHLELNALTAIKSQSYGYKLGLLMTAEAFVTGGELVIGR